MKQPQSVANAVWLIWLTLAITVAGAVVNRLMGQTTQGAFFGVLFIYALCAVLPYKIGTRHNWARYAYAVITALGFAVMFAGETEGMTTVDKVFSWVMLPIEVWILYLLFRPESSGWFGQDTE